MRHATWLLNRFQRRQNGATAFENLKGVSYKKPLMQFGERCHWLEAERITHKYGVIQVRTVRRLTREQRNDDVSKRAFDNFIGSPRNLSGSKPSLEEQTAHGEMWTLTPGCKGCLWARRGYHHTKACKAKKREFLLMKARSEELRATEADAWRKPASATEPSSSDLHERKERNVNLWTSSFNFSPT